MIAPGLAGRGLAGLGAAWQGWAGQGKAINTRKERPMAKRVVVIADMHCGHHVGLTPPQYRMAPEGPEDAVATIQEGLWNEYVKAIEALKPVDILIVNGDCIEGKGERSGGTELLTSDRLLQVGMAAQCIETVGAAKVCMTYGTPYHAGKEEDWEAVLAEKVSAEIHSHLYLNVNGCVFDVKHKVGASVIPHGRHTAVARDLLWNLLWAREGIAPESKIVLRSHVHYFGFNGNAHQIAMTTPCLLGLGSKYGARQCSGTVDWGLVAFQVEEDGTYSWEAQISDSARKLQKVHVVEG